ncbi:uracil-DNA glycosylase family protein [Melioribacteraceae bacterium 4301-Me]|uniref:uracil-DNA glycosylase family protein n=1 Tax=Pyranulibacter aquaticus TaxID=3163344 RepID=UPI00359A950C
MKEITKNSRYKLNKEKTFASLAINFFVNLNSPKKLPHSTEVMNPYRTREVQKIICNFFYKFYNDTNNRIFILGINPGRFGGGITGIPFTDPIRLEENCGIKNPFPKKLELSSRFIYKVIEKFGGPELFYSKFYISALYPLALIKDGVNYNYYDNKELYFALKDEIKYFLKKQFQFGAKNDFVISLGKKNTKFLKEINDELLLFKEIITLEHPRYIMQYRQKFIGKYISKYLECLNSF